MKATLLLSLLLYSTASFNQKHTPLPHGIVYGDKPKNVSTIQANTLETLMGKRTRITTTLTGKVLKVTKPKGGWFEIDAGSGKIISAHFVDAHIDLPPDLKGRSVIIEGVAQKQFIADDLQHFAGDTVTGKRQHRVKVNEKQRLTFEVKGLMVDK